MERCNSDVGRGIKCTRMSQFKTTETLNKSPCCLFCSRVRRGFSWLAHGAGRGHWQPPVRDSFPPPHPLPLSGLRAPSTWGPCCGPCCCRRHPDSDRRQQPQPGQRHQGESSGTNTDKTEVLRSVFYLFSSFLSLFLCLQIKEENIIPQIKLEPHEVDQFLNLSPKGLNLNFLLLLLLSVMWSYKDPCRPFVQIPHNASVASRTKHL